VLQRKKRGGGVLQISGVTHCSYEKDKGKAGVKGYSGEKKKNLWGKEEGVWLTPSWFSIPLSQEGKFIIKRREGGGNGQYMGKEIPLITVRKGMRPHRGSRKDGCKRRNSGQKYVHIGERKKSDAREKST